MWYEVTNSTYVQVEYGGGRVAGAGLNRPCASASRDTRPYFILKFHHFRYLFFIDDHTSNCARTDAFYLCIYGRVIVCSTVEIV